MSPGEGTIQIKLWALGTFFELSGKHKRHSWSHKSFRNLKHLFYPQTPPSIAFASGMWFSHCAHLIKMFFFYVFSPRPHKFSRFVCRRDTKEKKTSLPLLQYHKCQMESIMFWGNWQTFSTTAFKLLSCWKNKVNCNLKMNHFLILILASGIIISQR